MLVNADFLADESIFTGLNHVVCAFVFFFINWLPPKIKIKSQSRTTRLITMVMEVMQRPKPTNDQGYAVTKKALAFIIEQYSHSDSALAAAVKLLFKMLTSLDFAVGISILYVFKSFIFKSFYRGHNVFSDSRGPQGDQRRTLLVFIARFIVHFLIIALHFRSEEEGARLGQGKHRTGRRRRPEQG